MQALERNLLTNDWITFVFLFSFVLLFLMKVYKPKRLHGYTIAFFAQGFIQARAEKNPSIFSGFHGLLFLFNTLVLACFCVEAFPGFFTEGFTTFFMVFLILILYLLVRYFVETTLVKLLNIESQIQYFRFTKLGYMYTISLWLYPLLIVNEYALQNSLFLKASFLVLLLVRAFLILFNNKKLIFNQLFYFILYFCAFEIAPLLILYKLINT